MCWYLTPQRTRPIFLLTFPQQTFLYPLNLARECCYTGGDHVARRADRRMTIHWFTSYCLSPFSAFLSSSYYSAPRWRHSLRPVRHKMWMCSRDPAQAMMTWRAQSRFSACLSLPRKCARWDPNLSQIVPPVGPAGRRYLAMVEQNALGVLLITTLLRIVLPGRSYMADGIIDDSGVYK